MEAQSYILTAETTKSNMASAIPSFNVETVTDEEFETQP